MSILNKSFSRISINLLQIAKYSVNVTDTTSPFVFKSNFTTEEQQKVLNILNSPNLERLTSVSHNRIKNLEVWKNKKGPFRSLNDVLEVDGLGEKLLEKICEQIIKDDANDQVVTKKNGANRRYKQLLTPSLPANLTENIQSTVGIHLGSVGMSWAKLSRFQNELSSWNSLDFSGLPKKLSLTDNFELAMKILEKLPPADVFILEGSMSLSPQATTNTSAVTTYNQQLELTSMLIALLNTSSRHSRPLQRGEEPCVENIVYQLKPKLPARLFRTLVGNERVSALTTVTELVQNDGKLVAFSLPCTPICMDDQLRRAFLSQSPPQKELLGQALLLAVSFMDLCLYKNPISLVAIGPGKNNK